MKKLSLIVAMTRERVIGVNNELPWHLPEDLKYFKEVTMGSPIIMGRKTFESIGRPLPGRSNIVVTRNKNYSPKDFLVSKNDGDLSAKQSESLSLCRVVHSLEDAIILSNRLENNPKNNDPFLIGGAELFNQGIDQCSSLYITWIEKNFEGDAHFPEIDLAPFELKSETKREAPFKHSYCVYSRKSD